MPLYRPSNSDAPVLSQFSLHGKVAAVTGGARGIGLEIARGLAEAGASVAIIYSSSRDAHDTASQIAADTGAKVAAYQGDVRRRAAIAETIRQIVADFGRLDVVVANAGVCADIPSLEYTEETWQGNSSVNYDGVMWTAQAAGKVFKEQGRGNLIITASVSATLVNVPQRQAAYNASKAAVVQLAKVLAVEWVDFARVNCVSPGFVETDMLYDQPKERMEQWLSLIPGGRMAAPSELKGNQQEVLGSGPGRYRIRLLEVRIRSLDVLLDFLVLLDRQLCVNVEIASDPTLEIRMFLDEWRLQQGREFLARRIAEEQLHSHYRTIDDMMREVGQRVDRLQPPPDQVTLRSFFVQEFRIIFDSVASHAWYLRRQLSRLRADVGTVPSSEVPSTGGNAPQPRERPLDNVDVFDFAEIPIDRPVDMGAFIIDHPMVMHESEVHKLLEVAYRAILERGDREQARNYVRHVIVLHYATHTETVSGLHRLLMAITTNSPNPTPLSQSRLDFERDVEREMDRIDKAVWNRMQAAVAEAAHRARSEHSHLQEHTAVTESERKEADPDEQGGHDVQEHTAVTESERKEADPDEQGGHDVFDTSSQAMEEAMLSRSPVEEPRAGGDGDP
ncbi:hypothetical protein MY4824_005715 [Beauveria thailandica]